MELKAVNGTQRKIFHFYFFPFHLLGGVKCYTPCYISVCRLNLDLQTMLYMYALIATQPPHLIQNNSFAVEPIGSKASYCSGGGATSSISTSKNWFLYKPVILLLQLCG